MSLSPVPSPERPARRPLVPPRSVPRVLSSFASFRPRGLSVRSSAPAGSRVKRLASLVAELGRVHAAVELLQSLDLTDVGARVGEQDASVRREPAVDVALPRVVRGESEALVAVV